MGTHNSSSPAKYLGAVTIAVGGVVLLGWCFNIPALKSILPGFVSMKANTAIGFILAGVALLLLAWAPSSPSAPLRWLARACAATVVLLGLLTLCQYLFGLNFGIDQLFFHEPAGTVDTFFPGRMALNTALNFFLFGCALLLLGSFRGIATAQRLALCTGLMGLLPLLGYLYGASALIGVGQYTQMALHTALLFIVLSLGVLLLHPADGVMRLVTSDTRGGWILRRVGPMVIGLPVLLGWLRIWGERSGQFESALGVALMMLILIILLTGILLWMAHMLIKDEIAAISTNAALTTREALYHSLFSNMLNGYAYCRMIFEDGQPRDFIYQATNEAFTKLTGLSDVVGRKISEVLPGHIEADPQLFELYTRVATTGQPEQLEMFVESLQMWLMLSVYCPAAEHFVAVFDVITDRKRADLLLFNSEMGYRRLFESAHDGILILDAETGMVVDVNPYLIELLGVTREAFLRKKVWELGSFSDLVNNEANFRELQAKQYIRYEDMALEGHDGKRHEVEFVSNVYQVNEQKVIQCNIRDISARKQAEEIMQQQAENLRTRNDALERLNRLAVNRELRMIALKQQANGMAAQLGQSPPYVLTFMGADTEQALQPMFPPGESEATEDPADI